MIFITKISNSKVDKVKSYPVIPQTVTLIHAGLWEKSAKQTLPATMRACMVFLIEQNMKFSADLWKLKGLSLKR